MLNIDTIRENEKISHEKIYSEKQLYEQGSWLAKPVKTVMDSLELLSERKINILDLGCGVGRNSIAMAQYCNQKEIICNIDCVDLLEMAICKLKENAIKYNVEKQINAYNSTIEDYEIKKEKYNYIIAVSVIEHVAGKENLKKTLVSMRDGIKSNGKIVIIMNTEVTEKDENGKKLEPMFEINISTVKLQEIIKEIFENWDIEKETIVPQEWKIPREKGEVRMNTNVVTLVLKRNY